MNKPLTAESRLNFKMHSSVTPFTHLCDISELGKDLENLKCAAYYFKDERWTRRRLSDFFTIHMFEGETLVLVTLVNDLNGFTGITLVEGKLEVIPHPPIDAHGTYDLKVSVLFSTMITSCFKREMTLIKSQLPAKLQADPEIIVGRFVYHPIGFYPILLTRIERNTYGDWNLTLGIEMFSLTTMDIMRLRHHDPDTLLIGRGYNAGHSHCDSWPYMTIEAFSLADMLSRPNFPADTVFKSILGKSLTLGTEYRFLPGGNTIGSYPVLRSVTPGNDYDLNMAVELGKGDTVTASSEQGQYENVLLCKLN